MDALAREDVWQTNARRQYLHPYLAWLWDGDVFFDDGDHFRATVMSDDNSLVAHIPTVRSDGQSEGHKWARRRQPFSEITSSKDVIPSTCRETADDEAG